MALHKQIRFEVKREAVGSCLDAIREYAGYVREWAARNGPEWTWATYQERDRPTRFVSVMWHASDAAESRHRGAEGTERFANKLYPHVVASEELVMDLIADSVPESEQGP